MVKIAMALCATLVVVAIARENPFVPSDAFENVTTPTNVQEERGDFEQQSLALPSSARVLRYVTFGYQSLDGDTQEVRMKVDKDIDWHDPLVVTKESLLLDPTPLPPNAPETNASEALPEMPENKKIVVPEALQELLHVKLPTRSEKEESETVSFQSFIAFEVFKNRILITTKDPLMRHFLVANPYKVVLDFKRDAAFYTKTLPVDFGGVESITMGNHNGHYRAAILLDGHYVYELKKTEGGVEVVLK
jgi:hypothetical protein